MYPAFSRLRDLRESATQKAREIVADIRERQSALQKARETAKVSPAAERRENFHTKGNKMSETLSVREIDLEQAEVPSDELADEYHCICNFCEKEVILKSSHASMYEKLVKSNEFYCAHCIRNNFYTKRKKDVLQMTFRAIFGYIYQKEYTTKSVKDRTVYLSEIHDFIDSHAKVGLLNPVFSYDPDTYIWFVDFSKIGNGKHHIHLEDIYKTVVNILACFNLFDSVPGVQMHKLYDKYNEAVKLFYDKRQRPEGKRLLNPTLSGAGGTAEQSFSYERTRLFLPKNLVIRI